MDGARIISCSSWYCCLATLYACSAVVAIFTVFVKICWPCSICWNWLEMDCSSCSICTMAWPDCVGSNTIPEPNCAFANGCNAAANQTASTVRVSFFIVLSLRRRWFRDALQRYGSTAVQRESLFGAPQGGPSAACTVRRVPFSWLRDPPFVPWSASLLSAFLRPRRSLDRRIPWHRPGIQRCIGPATSSLFRLCFRSRQG